MSERRFLIFTRRGPIEIHFKLSHYVSLALTIAVGISSIIYYSIVGISSAIDVAQKDIITEASANLPTNFKENKSNKIESNSVLNEINMDETRLNNNKTSLESNISLPEQTNEIKFNTKITTDSEEVIIDKIYANKLDNTKIIGEQNTKVALNTKIISKYSQNDAKTIPQ